MSLADRRGPLGTRPFGELLNFGEHQVYLESSPKRVRVEVATDIVADSLQPRLLHQPGAPASWWFPRADVRADLLEDVGDREEHALLGRTRLFDLHLGERVVRRFAHDHPDVPALDGLVHVDCHQADRIYEEDELVAAEAIDPFHRVDVRDTSRHVRISLDGVILAESHAPRMVFETTARPRFYFTGDELRTDLLAPSDRQAICQYKGNGDYFHVKLAERLVRDLVWRYTRPNDDGRRIVGRYAVHHERCRTEVDGRELTDGGR